MPMAPPIGSGVLTTSVDGSVVSTAGAAATAGALARARVVVDRRAGLAPPRALLRDLARAAVVRRAVVFRADDFFAVDFFAVDFLAVDLRDEVERLPPPRLPPRLIFEPPRPADFFVADFFLAMQPP
jgi:hypothetical protein